MNKYLITASAIALMVGLGGCTNFTGAFTNATAGQSESRKQQMTIADAALQAGDTATATRIYRELAQDPLALEPRIRLGEALLAAGAPQEAARAYEGANSITPTLEGLVGLGRVNLALRQPAEALREFDHAARMSSNNAAVMNGRAVALDQLGRHDEAQQIYLAMLQADPSNIRIRNNYALSLALAGKYDDAADILTSLVQVPDADGRIRQNLALVYGLAGNDGQAAHFARMDLDEDAVGRNLDYYQRIRNAKTATAKSAALTAPSPSLVAHPEAMVPVAQASASAPNYASAPPASAAADLESHDVAPTAYRAASPDTSEVAPAAEAPVTVQGVTGSTNTVDGADAQTLGTPAEASAATASPPKPAKSTGHAHHASLLSLPLTRAEAREHTQQLDEEMPLAAEPAQPAPMPKVAPRIASAVQISAAPEVSAPGAIAVQAPLGVRRPAVPPLATPDAIQTGTGGDEIHSQSGDNSADMRVMNVTPRLRPINVAATMAVEPAASGVTSSNSLDTGVRRPAVPSV